MKRGWVLLVVGMAACAPLQRMLEEPPSQVEEWVASVTIARDEWGVPHVYGPTDASVAFGLAYAQAEDHYAQIDAAYMTALGRGAYWYGAGHEAADLVKAAFEVERLSREEYAREPAERRAVWDAFVAGLNYYVQTQHPEPQMIGWWEPWMLFARPRAVRAGDVIEGVELGVIAGDGSVLIGRAGAAEPPTPAAGAALVLGAAQSPTGVPLLLHSAHSSYFGGDQLYEMHVQSDEGWNVRGVVTLGLPVPHAGQTEHVVWARLDAAATSAEVVRVAPEEALVEWQDTVQVNTTGGVVDRVATFLRTQYGPVVAVDSGRALAVRIPRHEEGGTLQALYAMSRARTAAEAVAAADQGAGPGVTAVAADDAGNMHRSGGAAGTGAQQDSASGVLHTGGAAAAAAERLMSADGTWTWETVGRVLFDTRAPDAAAAIRRLVLEWEELGGTNPDRAFELDEAVALLRAWDSDITASSEAAAVFVLWQERLRADSAGAFAAARALEAAVAQLERDWQQVAVPWGSINRLQRPAAAAGPQFHDSLPSLPLGGAPAWTGVLFSTDAAAMRGNARRYATQGASWIAVMEPGVPGRMRSILQFGQSGDAMSPHFFDQAPLFAAGELKNAWLARDDVMAHAQRVYRPGGAAVQ